MLRTNYDAGIMVIRHQASYPEMRGGKDKNDERKKERSRSNNPTNQPNLVSNPHLSFTAEECSWNKDTELVRQAVFSYVLHCLRASTADGNLLLLVFWGWRYPLCFCCMFACMYGMLTNQI